MSGSRAGRAFLSNVPDDPRRHARDDRVIRNIPGHNRACSNQGPLANRDAAENCGTAPYGRLALNVRRYDRPIGFCLEFTITIDRSWVGVVDKDDTMSNKHSVFYADTLTDKRVAGYLAALSDCRPPLNLNESPDPGLGAYRATVQVNEFRMMNNDTRSKPDVVRNHRFSPAQ